MNTKKEREREILQHDSVISFELGYLSYRIIFLNFSEPEKTTSSLKNNTSVLLQLSELYYNFKASIILKYGLSLNF